MYKALLTLAPFFGSYLFLNRRSFVTLYAITCILIILSLGKARLWQSIHSVIKLDFLSKKTRGYIYELIVLLFFGVFVSPEVLFSARALLLLLFVLITFTIIIINIDYITTKINPNAILISRNIVIGYFITIPLALLFQRYIISENYFIQFQTHNTSLNIFNVLIYSMKPSYGWKIDYHGTQAVNLSIIVFWFFFANRQVLINNKIFRQIASTFFYGTVILVATQTHSATLKIMILLSPIVYIVSLNLSKIMLKRIISFILILIFVGIPLICYFLDYQKIFLQFPNLEPSFKHRICILQASMEKIIENPLSGNGIKSSRFFMKEEQICTKVSDHIIYYNTGYHQHNIVIQILFEVGIFGIYLLLRLLLHLNTSYFNKYKFHKITNHESSSLALIVCFFTMLLFTYSYLEIWLISSIISCTIYHKAINRNIS